MKALIIGFGYLGKALSHRLLELDSLHCIVSKHFSASDLEFRPFVGRVQIFNSLKELNEIPEVVFITTSDSQIPNVVDEIVSNFPNQLEGRVFIHCSGIHSDKILNLLERKGGTTASAHPLQTFYKYHSGIFDRIFWIVQSEKFELVQPILEQIGGTALKVELDDAKRALYHASAVVASNFLNSLLLFAKKLIAQTNLSPDILVPLIDQTLKNNLDNFQDTNYTPLTGPIIRSDFSTIEKHLDAMKSVPFIAKIYSEYCLASAWTANLNKNISDEQLATLEQIISKLVKSE